MTSRKYFTSTCESRKVRTEPVASAAPSSLALMRPTLAGARRMVTGTGSCAATYCSSLAPRWPCSGPELASSTRMISCRSSAGDLSQQHSHHDRSQ